MITVKRPPTSRSRLRAGPLAAVLAGALAGVPAFTAHGQEGGPPATGAGETPVKQPPAEATPQPEGAEQIPKPEPRSIAFHYELNGMYEPSVGLDGAGDVSIWRTEGRAFIAIPVGDWDRLDIEAGAEFSFYNFKDAVALAPDGDPIGATQDFRLGARYFMRTAIRWGVFVSADIASAGEPGAKFADSIYGGGQVGARYWFSRELSITGGLNIRTYLEDGVKFIPFFGIDWQIAENLTLATGESVIDPAKGLSLIYRPAPDLRLSIDGGLVTRQFRLDQENQTPEGALRDRRLPIALGVGWDVSPHVTLTGSVGVDLWQEYKLRDRSGNEVATVKSDPQLFFTVGLEAKF